MAGNADRATKQDAAGASGATDLRHNLAAVERNRDFQMSTPAAGNGSLNPPAPASSGVKPALKFKVERYEVRGNTLLASNVISRVLAPFTGR